jgi:hypothetical protein
MVVTHQVLRLVGRVMGLRLDIDLFITLDFRISDLLPTPLKVLFTDGHWKLGRIARNRIT